ncbi:protein of unknown function [Clostridium beijerinckii]|nr:protein of unknown function [Clostridium beijerinckii]
MIYIGNRDIIKSSSAYNFLKYTFKEIDLYFKKLLHSYLMKVVEKDERS